MSGDPRRGVGHADVFIKGVRYRGPADPAQLVAAPEPRSSAATDAVSKSTGRSGSWLNRTIARRLYLLRHAKSSWDDPTLCDRDRPLAPKGRKAAEQLARHFGRGAIRPDLVLCSSAARARETLAPIASAVGLDDRIQVEPLLYAAAAHQLLARLRRVDDIVTSVLLVAHNPGLQDLALDLAGDDPEVLSRLWEKFPTGALAVVACDGSWCDLSAGTSHIASLVVPRELPS